MRHDRRWLCLDGLKIEQRITKTRNLSLQITGDEVMSVSIHEFRRIDSSSEISMAILDPRVFAKLISQPCIFDIIKNSILYKR